MASQDPLPHVFTVMTDNQFLGSIAACFNQPDMSDLTVQVGDKTYFAHKMILGKTSTVFKTMIYSQQWTEATENKLHLSETADITANAEIFEHFLWYFYSGKVHLNN